MTRRGRDFTDTEPLVRETQMTDAQARAFGLDLPAAVGHHHTGAARMNAADKAREAVEADRLATEAAHDTLRLRPPPAPAARSIDVRRPARTVKQVLEDRIRMHTAEVERCTLLLARLSSAKPDTVAADELVRALTGEAT